MMAFKMSSSIQQSMIQLAVFVTCLLLLPTSTSGLAQDGECYSPEAVDVFRTSSGGYDASMTMNGTTCTLLCQEFQFTLAGVVSNKYCLCGITDDLESRESHDIVKKLDSKECGPDSFNVKIFKTTATPNKVIETKVTPSSLRTLVDETVSFEVSVLDASVSKMLDDLDLSLDFGDGTPVTRVTSENKKKVEHIYRVPGKYLVKLHAKIIDKNLLVSGSSVLIAIGQKFDDSEISFECLPLVEPGDNVGCNISAFGGQDLTVEINYGDGSVPFVFNASGEYFFYIS